MSQNHRAKAFLEELDELTRKYDFEVTAEGTSPLLYDSVEKNWIEFGRGFLSDRYKIYED